MTNRDESPTTARRIDSFDLLRGVAVLLMMEQHLGVWLWRGPAPGHRITDYPVLLGINILGGGAAPAFLMLAGVGAALFLGRAERSSLRAARRVLGTRGVTILLFGYLLSLLTPSWFTLRSWYVLHLIGLSQLVIALFGRRGVLLATVCVAVLAATPWVQGLLGTPAHLTNLRMTGADPMSTTGGVLRGGHLRLALAEGQFPILPWFAIFGWGAICGAVVPQTRAPRRLAVWGGVLALVGGAMVVSYHVLRLPLALSHPRIFKLNIPFFPCTPAFILLMGGALAVVMAALLARERKAGLRWAGPLCSLGRCSLSALIVHVVVFRELVRPLGLWQACDVTTASAILLGTLVGSMWIAHRWRRIQFRYGAEWLLRRAVPSESPPASTSRRPPSPTTDKRAGAN